VKVYHDAPGIWPQPDARERLLLPRDRPRANHARRTAAVAHQASRRTAERSIRPRSLATEIDTPEANLLAAYRPPASIERHPEFIRASATLKEARELDAAGQRHGALLRYLQAVQRLAPLRPAASASPDAPAPPVISASLDEWDARLSKTGENHSVARLFLEEARSTLERGGPGTNPATPAIVATEVLPRYLAALEPAKPARARPAASVTVTLVRWPYTRRPRRPTVTEGWRQPGHRVK
jgi:hypothetical protein